MLLCVHHPAYPQYNPLRDGVYKTISENDCDNVFVLPPVKATLIQMISINRRGYLALDCPWILLPYERKLRFGVEVKVEIVEDGDSLELGPYYPRIQTLSCVTNIPENRRPPALFVENQIQDASSSYFQGWHLTKCELPFFLFGVFPLHQKMIVHTTINWHLEWNMSGLLQLQTVSQAMFNQLQWP